MRFSTIEPQKHIKLYKKRELKIIKKQVMVFSSIPAYLDPANWQQHPNHQQAGGNPTHQLPLSSLPPPPPLLSQSDVGPEGIGTIRPGSMSERARLANMPMPDPALKCPRCESTNTKFCYFNNYNLTQPRHFCKTCRRYWTRGGALRSVPVGGGCRRNNKRTKSTSSNNSPASATTSTDRQTNSQNSTASTVSSTSPTTGPGNILGLMTSSSQIHQPLRFLSPLGQLSLDHHHHYYGGITSDINLNNNINYNNGGGGISTAPAAVTSEIMNFQLGTNFLGNGIEPWRFQQQFPFLGGLDLSAAASSSLGLFGQFQGGIGNNNVDFVGETSSQVRPKFSSSSMLTSQLASVKMEEHNNNGTNNQEANLLSRQLMMGMNNQSNDQWSTGTGAGNNWTDLSSLSSSSTSNPL